jgi:hypothetical protein
MRLIGKLIIIIILLGMLLGASAYIIIYTEDNSNSNGGNDITPPQITQITGNFTVTAGQTATITTLFSDNVNVTVATFYYKTADATSWSTLSIIDGSVSITIPSSTTSNYYYYITIDDAAGNGPVGNPSTDGSQFYTIIVKPSGNNNGDEVFIHTVLIEESTAVTCRYCPNVGTILHTLESAHNYRFYYISLVQENSKAAEYLSSVYNWYANPIVYIDGGYRVIYGGLLPEANYTTAIQAAENRVSPKIRVTVTAEYKNTTNIIATNVLVENGEQSTYTGRLRVYLTEIISSKFNDYNGQKYRNAFVDFIINEDISVSANSNRTFSANWPIGTLDYENLKLIAAVFSATGNTAYSAPLTNEYPFTAHYADATNMTYVAQGARNLPPEVGILSPQQGKIYFRGNQIFKFLYNNNIKVKIPWLIGKASIDTYAKDADGIAKVEIYVDDDLVANFTSPPYNWTIPSTFIKKPLIPTTYTILVKAYDDTGKTATDSIDIKAWWVF